MLWAHSDAIVRQAAKHPNNAPRYAVHGEFLRGLDLEHACRRSRWDD